MHYVCDDGDVGGDDVGGDEVGGDDDVGGDDVGGDDVSGDDVGGDDDDVGGDNVGGDDDRRAVELLPEKRPAPNEVRLGDVTVLSQCRLPSPGKASSRMHDTALPSVFPPVFWIPLVLNAQAIAKDHLRAVLL